MRSAHGKERSAGCYERKVAKVTKWYEGLDKNKEQGPAIDAKTGLPYPKKELKPLSWYLDQIKKPTGGSK